jgi:hypothetical protein
MARPILFQDAMIRAILAGTKTQTRRIVKPIPCYDPTAQMSLVIASTNKKNIGKWFYSVLDAEGNTATARGWTTETVYTCPYGKVGDQLYVRERFHIIDRGTDNGGAIRTLYYPATNSDNQDFAADHPIHEMRSPKSYPSIHMPRWASRITLEITAIRVERVQGITKTDAIAEGVPHGWVDVPDGQMLLDARAEFAILWDSINGKKKDCDWESNPFVWCLEFKRVEAMP